MINALEFLIAVIVVCEAKREEKTGLIFDCFDFSNKKNISYDELTILILCFTRALGICTGLKGESDEDLVESITQKKFQKTDKVGKEDYFKFVQDDLDLFNMNKMSDETLQCFGVKQPEIIQVSEEEKQKQLEQELEKELEQKLNVNDDETKEDAPKATPPSQEETNVEDNKKPPPTTEEEQNNIETTTPSPPTNTNATATVVQTEAEKTDDGVEKLPKTNVIVDGTGNKVVVGEV